VNRERGLYGKLPGDPARPRIRLARSLTGVVPEYPAAADYLAQLGGWQMLGNDREGDCVAVTWSNLRRLTTAVLATEFYPPMDQVQALYATQNPGGQDNGMVIQTCLEYLVTHGGPDGVKALGFAAVDFTNPAEVKAAMAIFGAVWVGFEVLAVNEAEFDAGLPWDYASGSADVGGHSVLAGGYGVPVRPDAALGGDEKFITWAAETSFTDLAWSRLVSECWAVIWPEHLGSREFMAGMDLATFAADYTAITGRPFPAPVPAPPQPSANPDLAFAAALRATGHDGRPWAFESHGHEATGRVAAAARAWLAAKGL